jgi:predicted aspartyl protease
LQWVFGKFAQGGFVMRKSGDLVFASKAVRAAAPALLIFFVCALCLASGNNAFSQAGVTECDGYAASDIDPNAKSPGIALDKINPAQAVPACMAALRQSPDNPRFLFQLGRAYERAGNLSLALDYYRKAGEQNYAAAENSLGTMYRDGRGVAKDNQQAADWYRKAGEQGLALAQSNLTALSATSASTASAAAATSAQSPATAPPVPLQRVGNNFMVPALINNVITLNFVVDSGAADVVIPADVVVTLARTGTLESSDYIGQQTFVLADGSRIPSVIFRIHSLRVGGWLVKDVVGSVAPVKSVPLLGQSFFKRFGSWSIDNAQQALVLLPPK